VSRRVRVQVVLALPHAQDIVDLELDAGSTLEQAVRLSGIPGRHPELGLGAESAGIFGIREPRDRLLADGDRVELYRPLRADPKAARRARADKARRR
jgi:putative ubiquitin-RnfH superfamily antitoxin RatB of RatAB toxin-antitoxin module